jgi:hypothetical protein
MTLLDTWATYVAQLDNSNSKDYTETNIISILYRFKSIEADTFFNAVKKKLVKVPFRNISDLKAAKKLRRQQQKEQLEQMKKVLEATSQQFDALPSARTLKESDEDMDVEEEEEEDSSNYDEDVEMIENFSIADRDAVQEFIVNFQKLK